MDLGRGIGAAEVDDPAETLKSGKVKTRRVFAKFLQRSS